MSQIIRAIIACEQQGHEVSSFDRDDPENPRAVVIKLSNGDTVACKINTPTLHDYMWGHFLAASNWWVEKKGRAGHSRLAQ